MNKEFSFLLPDQLPEIKEAEPESCEVPTQNTLHLFVDHGKPQLEEPEKK